MEKATTAKELNAVIVGSKGSHKHLVGNIILGRNVFEAIDAAFDCERGEGEVCERKVTLVQTPGWLRGYQPRDTPDLLKTEAILSVTLCPPGLHGFLLVINAELPFKDVHKKATKQYMEHFFAEKMWDHTVGVFSHKGDLDHEAFEDYIRKEGEPLQSLLEACGNRYHILRVDGTDNSKNVRQLFDKIDNMVAENSCYEIESTRIQSVQERRKEVDKKAEELRLLSKQKRQKLKGLLSEPKPHLRILMVGWVFSGKSAAGNNILGRETFQSGERTMKVSKQSGEVAGREVVVVDTPGWWKFFPASFTPAMVKTEIVKGVSLCSPSPNVVLLVVPPDTSFTDEQRKVTEENMKILGKRVWRHVIVLFTSGDTLGNKTIEQHIESEGEPLRWLIEKCGQRYHVIDNTKTADDQVTELLEKMEEMVAGNYLLYLSPTDDPQPVEEESDEQTEIKDESAAKKIMEQLNADWDRKNWEGTHLLKGNDSMEMHPLFGEDEQGLNDSEEEEKDEQGLNDSEEEEKDEQGLNDSEEEEEDKPETADDAGSGSLNMMKELMEREWVRREASMEQFYRFLADKEVSSEPDPLQLQESREKVLLWQQTTADSGYASVSYSSSKAEEDNEGQEVKNN